jgi:hypothetical protein
MIWISEGNRFHDEELLSIAPYHGGLFLLDIQKTIGSSIL